VAQIFSHEEHEEDKDSGRLSAHLNENVARRAPIYGTCRKMGRGDIAMKLNRRLGRDR